jgi:hypothetical protein
MPSHPGRAENRYCELATLNSEALSGLKAETTAAQKPEAYLGSDHQGSTAPLRKLGVAEHQRLLVVRNMSRAQFRNSDESLVYFVYVKTLTGQIFRMIKIARGKERCVKNSAA